MSVANLGSTIVSRGVVKQKQQQSVNQSKRNGKNTQILCPMDVMLALGDGKKGVVNQCKGSKRKENGIDSVLINTDRHTMIITVTSWLDETCHSNTSTTDHHQVAAEGTVPRSRP